MSIHTNATASATLDSLFTIFCQRHSTYGVDRHQDDRDYFYLSRIINEVDCEWFIFMDVDCHLIEVDALERLINYMDAHNYTICGVPDGGVIPIRWHHPNCINPFFVVLNRKSINHLLPLPSTQAERDKLAPSFLASRHIHHTLIRHPYEFCDCEASVLFNWPLLTANIRYLYLNAFSGQSISRYPSTYVFSPWGTPMAIHAWYARGMDQPAIDNLSSISTKALHL